MNNYNKNILGKVINLEPVIWNNDIDKFDNIKENLEFKYEDLLEAEERLTRFASLIKKLYPETIDGIIESDLVEAHNLKSKLENIYESNIKNKLLLKCDSHLKIAGSIKARGGIYEVLKFAEDIALNNGLITLEHDYSALDDSKAKEVFSKYKVVVGSTGNLGMSIGIISRKLGFKATVHMSSDAKKWKKDKLRSLGVEVIEYSDDYSKAVECGRKECGKHEYSYFIDDENSKNLFLGYSVAALRLKKQLEQKNIVVSNDNPLYVYLPCGVGGAPGGISFGLKSIYGDNVKCYFVEPVNAPCMLLGLLTGKYDKASVKNYGISLNTEADGLAVGSPSKLVSIVADKILDGIYTIEDDKLFELLYLLKDTQDIKIEPSAASSILGPIVNKNKIGTHICWLTGGSFLPDEIYIDMYNKGRSILK